MTNGWIEFGVIDCDLGERQQRRSLQAAQQRAEEQVEDPDVFRRRVSGAQRLPVDSAAGCRGHRRGRPAQTPIRPL